MAKRSRTKKKKKKRVANLTDDLIVEIICRLPYRSLCRFKTVSRWWFAVCSDPEIRKKSPQTLSGFFCYDSDRDDDLYGLRFLNISGRGQPLIDPSLPFLRGLGYESIMLKRCCGGLLLCAVSKEPSSDLFDADYVVCNPATQKWTVLPDTGDQQDGNHTLCLGFDPSVPFCFHVFMFVLDALEHVMQLKIYSSETGVWIFRQIEWGDSIKLNDDVEPVFFEGTLYAVTSDYSLITVDTEGNAWRKIHMPRWYLRTRFMEAETFIAHFQGRVYAMYIDYHNDNQLSVWQFESDDNKQWTLKHTAWITRLLGRLKDGCNEFYQVIAAHPERNLIFLTGGMGNELLSYDLDKQKIHGICTLEKYSLFPMLPYVPCFADWPFDGH